MQVLIGYDGSESARDAIRELHRAGLPPSTRARLVCVADVSPGVSTQPVEPLSGGPSSMTTIRATAEAAVREAQANAEEGAALLRAEFPQWTVAHATYIGSPAEELLKLSEGVPDLIVVGSEGWSGLGRLLLGSVSQNVLIHAPCSVRISRRPQTQARAGAVRIILGIDGSPNSALAVSAVAARVWPGGTEVKVITALDLNLLSMIAGAARFRWSAPWSAPHGDDAQEWASEAVEAVAAELRASGLAATPVIEQGNPKQLLLDHAAQWPADCIVLGARGHSGVERFLLGSVSAAVSARASCSVEVVRQG